MTRYSFVGSDIEEYIEVDERGHFTDYDEVEWRDAKIAKLIEALKDIKEISANGHSLPMNSDNETRLDAIEVKVNEALQGAE